MKARTTRRAAVAAGAALLVAASALLAGCTSSSSSGAAASSELDDILKTKTLTVGMDLEYKPEMYIDNGKPAGYDVDLLNLMAKDLGVKLKIENQKFEALVPGLISGKFDLVSVGLVNTPERAKTVWFSSPYVPYSQLLLGNSKYPAGTTVADLDKPGKVISVLTGSTAAELAKREFSKAKIEELDQQAALLEVSSGRADATIAEEYIIRPFQKQNTKSTTILNNNTPFATQYGAYAMPEGDTKWLQWVNNWIAYRTADGTLDSEYRKWIEPTFQ